MTSAPDEPAADATTHEPDPAEWARPEIPVPPPRESRRDSRRRRKKRRRRTVVLVPLAVALIAAAAGSWVVTGDLPFTDSKPTSEPPPSPPREARTLLLAHRAGDGSADLLMLLGVDQGPREASVLLLPTTTLVEIPTFGVKELGKALDYGGADLLRLSLSNAIGVDIGSVIALDDAQLLAMIDAAGSIEVTLREPIGTELEAGAHELAGQQLLDLLVHPPPETDEIEHLVAVHALVEAWFKGLSREGALERAREAVPSGPEGDADAQAERAKGLAVLQDVVSGQARFDTLPVASGPGGEASSYTVDEAKLATLVRREFSGALLGSGVRPRVEILNGSGGIADAPPVADDLVRAGFRYVLTGNAPRFDYVETEIIYYESHHAASAQRARAALGVGKVLRGGQPIRVADLTIVIGADYVPDKGFTLGSG